MRPLYQWRYAPPPTAAGLEALKSLENRVLPMTGKIIGLVVAALTITGSRSVKSIFNISVRMSNKLITVRFFIQDKTFLINTSNIIAKLLFDYKKPKRVDRVGTYRIRISAEVRQFFRVGSYL